MDSGIIALLSAIFGGIGLKAFEAWNNRGEKKITEGDKIRDEWRQEAQLLRKEIVDFQRQLDEWKQKYYTLFVEHGELKASHGVMESNYNELKEDYEEMKTAIKLRKDL